MRFRIISWRRCKICGSENEWWRVRTDLIVATHGRGFWILDDITPLEQFGGEVPPRPIFSSPEAPIAFAADTNTDTPLPPETPAGENPPDGAIINYSLGQAPSGPVTLEIFDAAGKLVRRFQHDKPEFDWYELERTLGVPTYWVRPPRVLARKLECIAGFGIALSAARSGPPRLSDFRGAARHAAGTRRSARRAGNLYGETFCEWPHRIAVASCEN